MKKNYYIEFKANPVYPVEAESPQEAYEKALEWFAEYLPQFRIAESEEPFVLNSDEIQNWSNWNPKM